MEIVSLGPGETVIRQDEVADKLWVVIEGVLGVSFLDRRDSPRSLPDLAARQPDRRDERVLDDGGADDGDGARGRCGWAR